MTQLVGRASLLVAFYVLISAATAYAECAWVLWESDQIIRHQEVSTKKWSVLNSTETLSECKANAAKGVETSIQVAKKAGLVYTVHQEETTVTSSDDRTTFIKMVSYLCLPDTVDPRGPKGK